MTKKEIAKRYVLFIISLFFAALGVAFTKKGELGVSPISSVANILSFKYTVLSLGSWLIVWNCVLIAGQILILRKKFEPIQLLQVPLSFLFGYFTDFGMWCLSFFEAQAYALRLAMVVIGVTTLGFGISLSVIANVIMNAGEAFVKAAADSLHKDFGNVKIAFDICNVILAVLLSMIFYNFRIVGAREGTLISAVCTGMVVKFFRSKLQRPMNRILSE